MAAAVFTTATVDGLKLRIVNVTLAAEESPYTFPSDLISVTFNPAAAHTIALSAGGTTVYTLTAGMKEEINGRCLCGKTLYFNGTGALEMLLITGTNT